jgi:hypothetical protein
LFPSGQALNAEPLLSRKLWNKSGIADLEITGLRRGNGREQPAIGLKIESSVAMEVPIGLGRAGDLSENVKSPAEDDSTEPEARLADPLSG